MNPNKLKELLTKYDPEEVSRYIQYFLDIPQAKNPWKGHRTDEQLAGYFKSVKADNLDFDGKHITLISTGVSYDYVAYKNKMFTIYPETLLDVQLVHKDDEFSFKKDSGKVTYTHKINNPFGASENDLVGCYCVIKNSRGEFLNTLTMEEIQKHRKVAKTDFIWKQWFNEMVLKTIIKKACKTHFADIFQNMETLDNEQNDIEQPLGISIETKQEIEAINTVEELTPYFKGNEGKNAGMTEDFIKALAARKAQIMDKVLEEDDNTPS